MGSTSLKDVEPLTHWGRETHICVSKLTIIGSDNAIIWTNAGILLIGPLGINFSDNLIAINTFSFEKMHVKMSSEKCRPSCLDLSVLMYQYNISRELCTCALLCFFSFLYGFIYWLSRSYVQGVAAAQLRWHLSNMNMIKEFHSYFCKIKFASGVINEWRLI